MIIKNDSAVSCYNKQSLWHIYCIFMFGNYDLFQFVTEISCIRIINEESHPIQIHFNIPAIICKITHKRGVFVAYFKPNMDDKWLRVKNIEGTV